MSATSAISWASGGNTHTALYAIGQNDNVEVSTDGGSFSNLGGYAKQVSAGLTVNDKPEVYAIGANNAVFSNNGSGWVSLGNFYAKAISATVNDSVYAIGSDDAVYVGFGGTSGGFVRLGSSAKQISAGADFLGNHFVYAIGQDNAVYENTGTANSWIDLGGYAKQISAGMNHVVFAIGPDNAVFEHSGTPGNWTGLGFYAKQIRAGVTTALDGTSSGHPSTVYAIGLNDGLWVNSNTGSGWKSLGGYVTDISAPAAGNFGISVPANFVYGVEQGHAGFLRDGASLTSLGGYVQTLSGSASDDTDSWQPASRDSTSVSWQSGGVAHTALYIIGPNDNVEVSVDGGSFTNLAGYAKQISAGLSASGSPEVYAIGADNAVWVNNGSGWVSLGDYAKEISASTGARVYAIGTDDAVYAYVNFRPPTQPPKFGWLRLGDYAQQISAGTNTSGNPVVYAIGSDNAVYENTGTPNSWTALGGYAKQISSGMNGVVYAIGSDNAVYENTSTPAAWTDLGGYVKQISASTGQSEVYAIGLNDGLWVNSGSGWKSLGGDYVTAVSAPAVGAGLTGTLAYAVGQGHTTLQFRGTTVIALGGTAE
jgi:hypothetical protein